MPTPYSTHLYEEVTSTQDVARSLGSNGPVLVIAARQTAGRGRSGSSWETAPRAMAMSLTLDPRELGWQQERWTLIPLATGIAVARCLGLKLKWPNDVLVRGAKAGGILVEAFEGGVTLGIGLNLWWPYPPPERSGLEHSDPGPSAYVTVGEKVAEAVWAELAHGVDGWSYDEYCTLCVTLGREITWGEENRGTALSIDRFDGSLVADQVDAGRVKLSAGEVRHVRS